MPYKIEAVVKFNDGEALVLNKYPDVKYEEHCLGRDKFLIGIDEHGVFLKSYKYDKPNESFRAFGGRRFDIPMMDGTVEKAHGQWWDFPSFSLAVSPAGASKFWKITLGEDAVSVTIETREGLEECYVFRGGFWMDKEEHERLRRAYTGKVYGYDEYEEILKRKPAGVAS